VADAKGRDLEEWRWLPFVQAIRFSFQQTIRYQEGILMEKRKGLLGDFIRERRAETRNPFSPISRFAGRAEGTTRYGTGAGSNTRHLLVDTGPWEGDGQAG